MQETEAENNLGLLAELVRLIPPYNNQTYYILIIDVKDIASLSSFQEKFLLLKIHHSQKLIERVKLANFRSLDN